MNIVIDRINGNIAHLDVGGQIIEFPTAALPPNAKESDLLGFSILDNSKLLAEAQSRIDRLSQKSDTSNTFDL